MGTHVSEEKPLLRSVAAMVKDGRLAEVPAQLRDPLRRAQFSAEGIDKAGRFLQAAFEDADLASDSFSIHILGQCTTSWIKVALCAVGWSRGLKLRVTEGNYDNLLQDLEALVQAKRTPDVVILLPWNTRLLSSAGDRSPEQAVQDELDYWRPCWTRVTERLGARLLQVGYDFEGDGPEGVAMGSAPGGRLDTVARANRSLRAELPPGSYFVPLGTLSGQMGRENFYDPRRYFWTKQPFSEAGTVRLCEQLVAGIRALILGPKKLLALDLDNTLWGGVVGEAGSLGIELGEGPDGEAFRAFQSYSKSLSERGVLLAVVSKNNPADARSPFSENPNMILGLDDFAAFEASWEPKPVALRAIADKLKLGLDSFVFFDDNPAERELVRQHLPEVEVVDVPEDPCGYIRALQRGFWFEAVALTQDDRQRTQQYQEEHQRREELSSSDSIDDYLDSLEMKATVESISPANIQRVVQLIGKTNQFNLTTRRHSRAQVEALLERRDSICFVVRLRDRFGDYGLVSILIAVPCAEGDAGGVRVDTWLMSCRVIGRTLEHFVMRELLELAQQRGFTTIRGEFIRTKKNELVSNLYKDFGFAIESASEEVVIYEASCSGLDIPVTHVSRDDRS